METSNKKYFERVVSQKALQMGSSFPCQICVVGFLCGVCLTSLFLAALTSFGSFEFGGLSFSAIPVLANSPWNSSSEIVDVVTSTDCNFKPKETKRLVDSQDVVTGKDCNFKPKETESLVDLQSSKERKNDERVSFLYSAWSAMLTKPTLEPLKLNGDISVPKAPHLENCKLRAQANHRLDKRSENGSFPPWAGWKGLLDMHPAAATNERRRYSENAHPPWISGSDEENYPSTRKVQRDLWIHQHPMNCSDPNVKFLVVDWERLPGYGIGAQIAAICGLFAIAINEKRVLVTNYYNRADHDGCKGSSRSSWSCYFFPETSQECRDRAFELLGSEEAWKRGIITEKGNYSSKEIWSGRRIPRVWGHPWSYLQPTTEINGSLIAYHRKMDRRWWMAQAVRYLMRFQTEYTCGLLNVERHAAFGKEAAKLVLRSLEKEWPKGFTNTPRSDIEDYVWSSHKPWVARPLLSMHVRMGDKACEMKVVEFEEYMHLAHRIRKHFPHLNNVWLSTEMQQVIDKSKRYSEWNFYYTNVTRQVGNTSMASYELSLGRERSTNNPIVNFLMATEADFFIGALGSTWCVLIDGMRNTGGKVMAGYLSVNKDRFW